MTSQLACLFKAARKRLAYQQLSWMNIRQQWQKIRKFMLHGVTKEGDINYAKKTVGHDLYTSEKASHSFI